MATNIITQYHNPACSKSRATLQLLQNYVQENPHAQLELKVVEYLKAPLGSSDIELLRRMLGVPLRNMMRPKESAYAEHSLSDASADADLLKAMEQSPILLERPIVEFAGKAAIGRPPEAVLELLPGPNA